MITVPGPVQPAAAGEVGAAIRVSSLRKRYGDVTALADVDLEIRAGEFFTLLGPSGSGKTTLLRLIAGFERPDGGRVELGGRDVTGVPPYARNVNTVFQDYALFPHMTVAQNIEYGLRVRKVPKAERREKAGRALEMVRLPGLGGRKPAPSSTSRRCCCLTSRWARSTSSSARRCSWSCSGCSARSASRSSTSPTTRKRR
jgi:ABC-type Fe3+/spermidine/putrescine transport system ATPase subunit